MVPIFPSAAQVTFLLADGKSKKEAIMIDHFSIMLPENTHSEIENNLIQHLDRDPSVFGIPRGSIRAFAFCLSPESASFERQRFQDHGTVSPSICVLTLDEYGIQVSQECCDASRKQVAEVVKWILVTHQSARVYNDDTQEEITDMVVADPNVLFE